MLAIAGSSTSTSSLTASLSGSGGSAGAAPTGGRSSGSGGKAAVEITISRSSTTSVSAAATSPRDALAGSLKSLDASLDRLLAKGGDGTDKADDAQGNEKLDRLQFLLDSLQMILKDREMSSSDKMAMLGYLSNVANGKEPSDDAKTAFGTAMSGVADRANLPPGRAADYRDLLGRYAAVPETPGAGPEDAGSASVSRIESLSISIKGAFEVVTDKGTMMAEFEFTQETVSGFSAAIADGEAEVAYLSASRSSMSFSLTANSAYRNAAGAAAAPATPS